jgi:hypothetical protein
MRKAATLCITLATVCLLMGSASNAQEQVTITIAPNQFVLDYLGTKVTVHTNIPYGNAVNESIEMHNVGGASIDPIGFKSDDRGYLVVKFAAEDLQMIVAPPSAKLTMTGDLTAGDSFSATDVIRVK